MDQTSRPKPVILAIIDGWGVAPPWGGNAITLANIPFYKKAIQLNPNTTLKASGEAVGLPPGERGNSEVGHLTIGSGHAAIEAFPTITKAIQDGDFDKNEAIVGAFKSASDKKTAVHILGLASPGGIHSHIDHLFALLELAKKLGHTKVFIHAITDGRDSSPYVSQEFLAKINNKAKELGVGTVATVMGRYYAMDRDMHWDRTEKAYRAIVEAVGQSARSPEGAIASAYRDGFSDEFVQPTVVNGEGMDHYGGMNDGDSVIFFNFRGDRARQITKAIVQEDFTGFDRKKACKDIYFVGFTYYQEGLPIKVAFPPRDTKQPLAYVISEAGLKQFHIAESEKYAHVSYFFNGGRENPFPNESRLFVQSPKVASYDQKPEMSTAELTTELLKVVDDYDFVVVNYACPDMVGHTGDLKATIKACEAVDESLSKIADHINKVGGLLMITADHGNAEQMVNPQTGGPDTEHTSNPVPLIMVAEKIPNIKLRNDGGLSDVAPTILELLGLSPSPEMTGKSLIVK